MSAKKARKKAGRKKAAGKVRRSRKGTEAGGQPPERKVEELLSMNGAIALLKTTRPTFYRWLRSGKIKGMKVGRQWRFRREEIERFLEGAPPRADLPVDIDPFTDLLIERMRAAGVRRASAQGFERETTPLHRAVVAMIALATAMRASDIHLAPHTVEGEGGVKAFLRCRIDGTLHPVTTLDARLLPALVEEWKRMAACDVRENVKPQDGRIIIDISAFNRTFPKKTVDLWVNFLPTSLGESVTARILDRQAMSFNLDRIHYASRDRERILRALGLPWGLIMITGPAGCGKTTVLYSCLSRLADSSLKCLTIEDPVEYNLPWVSQVHVRRQAGLTYQAAARAILRSDPDVIVIGEARDGEILSLAQAAAVTGHLVFTTLHTDTAAGALKRMVNMGSDPFLVADSTKLILAQRLVRKLCPKCAVRCEPEPVLLASASEAARNGGIDPGALKKRFRKAVGCAHCSQTGYRGRTVVAEVLEMTGEIGKALRSAASIEQLEEIAIGQAMTTMAADAFRRAAAGETTVEEIVAALSLPSAMRPALHTTD